MCLPTHWEVSIIDGDWEGVSSLVITWNVHIISKISKGTVMSLIYLWAIPVFLAASDRESPRS
jgi:hypothetical protein